MAQEEEGTRVAAMGPGTLKGTVVRLGTRGWGGGPGHVGRESLGRGPWQGEELAGGLIWGRGEGREKGPCALRKGREVFGN